MRWWLFAYPQMTRVAPLLERRAVDASGEADFSTSANPSGDQRVDLSCVASDYW
jgi:hypothetical protein